MSNWVGGDAPLVQMLVSEVITLEILRLCLGGKSHL